MSNRIIDLTEKITVDGTESIPGTEQTSPSDTTPANKRWVWSTIKDWILSYVNDYYIRTLTFASDGNQDVTLDQYELVTHVIFRYNISTDYISVGTAANTTLYVEESSDPINAVLIYKISATPANRVIRVTASAACTVKLMSIKNL